MSGFRVGFDPDVWIEVPLAFPTDDFATADDWAGSVAEMASEGAEERLAAQAWLLLMALRVTAIPAPAAVARFWYFPVATGFVSVAHLYSATAEETGGASLETSAGAEAPSLTYPVVSEIDSPRFGRIVRCLSTESVPDDDDPAQSRVVGRVRLAADLDGRRFVLEVLDGNLSHAAVMLDDLTTLFESIEPVDLP